jgi:hypothetical protein
LTADVGVSARLSIPALRSTQVTVGLREVAAKRQRLELRGSPRTVPVVCGPGQQAFLRDGHHLVLALHSAGVETVRVAWIDDLSHLDAESFWAVLEERAWVYPFDGNGLRRDFAQMPASVLELEDDPFRSLAGELRRQGGFLKSKAAYAEFAWADYLRWRIDSVLVTEQFQDALDIALALALSEDASHLPGWCGGMVYRTARHASADLSRSSAG